MKPIKKAGLIFLGILLCLTYMKWQDISFDLRFQLNHNEAQEVQADKVDELITDLNENITRKVANKNFVKSPKSLAVIKRFKKVAREEQEKYAIPASITLAQAILETRSGESPLAIKNNNWFGMKCFSKNCKTGHCSNFSDDTHKDFFRIYTTAWESFRAHSKLLQAQRYRKCYDCNLDYVCWAKALKKAGYATDKYYSQKLINLIEGYNLQQYDKVNE